MSIYIKEIIISRFRSIGKIEIPVNEITIFSGKNNSGKSNILKALNLFFNKETSFQTDYNHDVDYNKFFRGNLRGARRITITLRFKGIGDAALKHDFWISREFGYGIEDKILYDSENKDTSNRIKENDGNITRQFTRFFNKINYVYIPAIRDRNFIKYLLQLFEDIIKADAANDKKLHKSMGEISDILQSKSSDIGETFSKFIGLQTSASLSSEIKDILGTVTINVQNPQVLEEYKKMTTVDIFSSGDGILMSYIMYFIAYMSSKISNKFYIWGFEEPETALEYSKVQALAKTFYNDFAQKAQIFITTHSPAFIKLKDKNKVNFYRVYQNVDKSERLLTYAKTLKEIEDSLIPDMFESSEYKLLQEELNMIEQAKEIEVAVEQLQEQRKQHSIELEDIKNQLEKGYPKKIFICEDEKAVELWENLLNDKSIVVISSCGCVNTEIEKITETLMNRKQDYSPVLFRTVDRDGYTDEQVKFIESQLNQKYKFVYKYNILPVCEIENFAVINHPNATEELWQLKRDDMREAFYKTAESNLVNLIKITPYNKCELFGKHNQLNDTINKMFKEAEKNWKYFINGKGMIDGLHYDKYIIENSSAELKKLISDIKSFFQENEKKVNK